MKGFSFKGSKKPSESSSYDPFQQNNPQIVVNETRSIETPNHSETNASKTVQDPIEEEGPEPPRHSAFGVHYRWQLALYFVRYVVVVAVIGIILAIPVIVFDKDQDLEDTSLEATERRQYNNLIYYIFAWLLTTWMCAVIADLVALSLPYLFRLIARYVNPAHQKYWRVFKTMRRPICWLGAVIGSFIAFTVLVNVNPLLAVNRDKTEDDFGWDDVVDDVLEQMTLWTAFYTCEKIMILYITIHYHYRSDLNKITHSKEMHNALIKLYEASTYLYPVGCKEFAREDLLIRNAKGNEKASSRVRVTSYLARLGIDGYKLTSFFGNFIDNDPRSHWLRPSSSYATVERALDNPKTAAALARRIWMALVADGSEAMTAADIAEVLGPFRKEEAAELFKVLDENESGDMRLEEMVWTVVESGRVRHTIYQSMADVDHCINTFDWVCLTILGLVMIAFILIRYEPSIKEIQSTVSFVAIGLSFAIQRSFHHFFAGVVFVFFDHPFDVGDRVELYNMASNNTVSCIVVRQSLLYTVFRRIDNGTDLQESNERLMLKRIENVTRSGINRQSLSIFVDFNTTFQDIKYLRSELESFLAAPENKRDYFPQLALSVVSVHELNKMEIKIAFNHRSNWSNEPLRAGRSNRFYCALVAALRRVPIYKPGGPLALGEDGKPNYTVMLTGEEAGSGNMHRGMNERAQVRIDAPEPDPKDVRAAMALATANAIAEAEKTAVAQLTKIPAVPKKGGAGLQATSSSEKGSSTAVEVADFIGVSATGMRQKNGGTGQSVLYHS